MKPTTGILRIATNSANFGLDGSRYSYAILNAWEGARIPALKAANPEIKVLAYKNAAFTRTDATAAQNSCGVLYSWANANYPDWFLLDTNGNRVESAGYPGLWLMDVGNPNYQNSWEASVRPKVKAAGFDGVFMDDSNESAAYHLGGRTLQRYPADSDWPQDSFMAYVGPDLKAAGLLAIPNIALDAYWKQSSLDVWDRWVGYCSGACQEYFSKWGQGDSMHFTDDLGWHNDWSYRQAYLARTDPSKIFIGITYAPKSDARSQRYARASFLLAWNGGPSALIFEPTDPEAQDPWTDVWTVDLGQPLTPKVQSGIVWMRAYERGWIAVNPNPTQTATLSNGVTIPPTDAYIYQGAPVPPPPPPPPDTTPPSAPTGLTASMAKGTLTLRWNPATDNFGVAGYRIYRNGVKIGESVMALPVYNYKPHLHVQATYSVKAVDVAGNVSAASNSVSVKT